MNQEISFMTNDKQNTHSDTITSEYSPSPAGELFDIPTTDDYTAEFERLEKLVQQARSEGKEIVVVMGVGFVGAVMAAIIADTKTKREAVLNSLLAASGPVREATGRSPCLTAENLRQG